MNILSSLFSALLLFTSLTTSAQFESDSNGFLPEAKVMLTSSCVRGDGVKILEWKATSPDYLWYVHRRVMIDDVVIAIEEEYENNKVRIDADSAIIFVHVASLGSRFNPMNIRDDLLEERGLKPWTGGDCK